MPFINYHLVTITFYIFFVEFDYTTARIYLQVKGVLDENSLTTTGITVRKLSVCFFEIVSFITSFFSFNNNRFWIAPSLDCMTEYLKVKLKSLHTLDEEGKSGTRDNEGSEAV